VPALSMSEAAQQVGRSKTSIWRAIKAGRLSATRTDDGDYAIDPAELARAFRPEPVRAVTMERQETGRNGAETAVLKARLEAEERVSAELRDRLAYVTRQCDAWQAQAEQAMQQAQRLLPGPAPAKAGFWRRLRGRG
jgi:hypothetical protein